MTGPPGRWPDGWPIFFDRQGQPMTAEQYEATFPSDPDEYMRYRRVGQDVLVMDGEPCNVSTVWIGIDMGFMRTGPPIIFETMVFGGPFGDATMRYATEMAAQEGHVRTVADLMAGRTPWFLRDELTSTEERDQ